MNEVVPNPCLEDRQHLRADPRLQPMRPKRPGSDAKRTKHRTKDHEKPVVVLNGYSPGLDVLEVMRKAQHLIPRQVAHFGHRFDLLCGGLHEQGEVRFALA